jgi:putative redox protein
MLVRMARAVARWSGQKVRFEIESGSGHTASIDEAPFFCDGAAMRPTEMLLAALGGCTGLNAVLLLRKFKQPLRTLAVEVSGDQEKEWPRAFTRIEVVFHCGWDGKPDDGLVDKALDLACNRYCPIHATIARGASVGHRREDVA